MNRTPEILRALVAAGASAEMLLAVVEAEHAAGLARRERKRAADAERQRRRRGRLDATDGSDALSPDVARDGGDGSVTDATPSSPALPPGPPNPPTPAQGESLHADAREAAFRRFWAAYPRRRARPEARRAFLEALARLPPGEGEGIVARALERSRRGWTDPRFVPHPANWLNREPWSDDPEPAADLQAPETPVESRCRDAARPQVRPARTRSDLSLDRSIAALAAAAGSSGIGR